MIYERTSTVKLKAIVYNLLRTRGCQREPKKIPMGTQSCYSIRMIVPNVLKMRAMQKPMCMCVILTAKVACKFLSAIPNLFNRARLETSRQIERDQSQFGCGQTLQDLVLRVGIKGDIKNTFAMAYLGPYIGRPSMPQCMADLRSRVD